MLNKTWKKCVFVFVIIFMIVLGAGVLSINYLHDTVSDNNIHPATVVVTDKYYNDTDNTYRYSAVTNGNQTLHFIDDGDSRGRELWDKIAVGGKYKFVVKKSDLLDATTNTNNKHNSFKSDGGADGAAVSNINNMNQITISDEIRESTDAGEFKTHQLQLKPPIVPITIDNNRVDKLIIDENPIIE